MFKNKKEIENKLSFVNEVLGVFKIYSECCDDYFKSVHNQKEHLELYNYYANLKQNLINCFNKYGD